MLFNSDIFIFLFLPTVVAGFYLLGMLHSRRGAVAWLVAASLLFYGWWNPAYALLLLFSVVFNYVSGIFLGQCSLRSRARMVLGLGIAVNLGLLGYFKYTHFLLSNIGELAGLDWSVAVIVLPLGISFFTFQQIAYLVDAYRGEANEYDPLDYALFVTFFPQLIAGPIVHHKEMMPQFTGSDATAFRAENLAVGLTIFFIGLFKKVVIADTAAEYASPIFDSAETGLAVGALAAWQGALAYTVQIYFDFSGYSDMAIGLGRMFGIRLPLNFNSPYQAGNIIDFWRRWHMTLSRFLRDYLYFPLGGNRRGPGWRYVNLMIVMLLGGLWHGAGWTFVIWGVLHGIYLAINHLWRERTGWGLRDRAYYRVAARALTFTAVVVAWVFFRAATMDGAVNILGGMVGGNGLAGDMPLFKPFGMLLMIVLLVLAFVTPNTQQVLRRYRPALESVPPRGADQLFQVVWRPTPAWAVATGLVAVFGITHLWRTSEFLYWQF